MDINAQRSSSLPTSSFLEVAEDGSQLAGDTEVVRPIPPTSEMLQSTNDSLITPSNGDTTVEIEMKSDTNALDDSGTKEILEVSLDHELTKENMEETIQLNRECPEILSDNALERMVEDENEDAICNLDQVNDAFVFCPYLKSIEMDSMMAQGIFQSETEMSEMDERKHSLHYKLQLSILTKNATQETSSKLLSTCSIT